jgi:hypothetical protein
LQHGRRRMRCASSYPRSLPCSRSNSGRGRRRTHRPRCSWSERIVATIPRGCSAGANSVILAGMKPEPPRPTLEQLRRGTPWCWVLCEHCMHRAPVAFVPFNIRWGQTPRATCCAHRARRGVRRHCPCNRLSKQPLVPYLTHPAGVPELRDGAPIGAIMVARTERRPFSEHEIRLLKTFADQAVIAIEDTRAVRGRTDTHV